MILARTDLKEQKVIPVDVDGRAIGLVLEVNTETKIAKCHALLLRDHPNPSEVLDPVKAAFPDAYGPPPDFTPNSAYEQELFAAIHKWQREHTPVEIPFTELAPYSYHQETVNG